MKTTRLQPVDELIVTVFRLNGSLIDAGNRLVADIGLTSAWWQVLGALALSPVPLTVPQIARNMGIARQSVQRVIDLLNERSLVRLDENPHHRRAKLATLTREGAAAFEKAMKRQRPWAENLAAGLSDEAIAAAVGVLKRLDQRLAEARGARDHDRKASER
jgi:DNA-binding MarR family transcriptional regulator